MKKILILGHTFPESTTTAAGTRMLQLISLFRKLNYKIYFATTANKTNFSDNLKNSEVEVVPIKINNSSFNDFVSGLCPDIVLYDRFVTEEQFGWRVSQVCPDTITILDTEDLHFLRKAREEAFRKKSTINLFSETAKREIASILRCDVSLIISEYEMHLLQNTFKIDASLLFYLPLLVESFSEESLNFQQRKHFVTIGNFMHKPNLDSVIWLKKDIWKKIRKQLPNAELHIYGAYIPQQVKEFHNPEEGFIVKGWTPTVSKTMQEAKVCLAPLRFGAGLKGKIIDAMQQGTPVITTPIGAEGIAGDIPFCGSICRTEDELCSEAIEMYILPEKWQQAQKNGYNIVQNRFFKQIFFEAFGARIKELTNYLTTHRNKNFITQIVKHHTLQSTKYLSKWIEEKNKH